MDNTTPRVEALRKQLADAGGLAYDVKMTDLARQLERSLAERDEQVARLRDAVEAAVIFFGNGPFTKEQWDRWYEITCKYSKNPAQNIAPCTSVVAELCRAALSPTGDALASSPNADKDQHE